MGATKFIAMIAMSLVTLKSDLDVQKTHLRRAETAAVFMAPLLVSVFDEVEKQEILTEREG